jgi:hypothetical protein
MKSRNPPLSKTGTDFLIDFLGEFYYNFKSDGEKFIYYKKMQSRLKKLIFNMLYLP